LPWFKAEVERRAGIAFEEAKPFTFDRNGDRFGWTQGEDGRWHLTLRIESGRVADRGDHTHLGGLREIARIHDGEFRLTPNQNLVIANVARERRDAIDALVIAHHLDTYRSATPLLLDALACVALPTCGQAFAEAERYLPELLQKVQRLLDARGLRDEPITLRISGCPNGCSRPYVAEIALIGKALGRYNLMLGGDVRGQRLNTLYRENIDEAETLAALDAVFERFAAERADGEAFGDFLHRSSIVSAPKRIAVEAVVIV
jgi:sulfite reductase (NADPH) hemoprotein beta-component